MQLIIVAGECNVLIGQAKSHDKELEVGLVPLSAPLGDEVLSMNTFPTLKCIKLLGNF